MSCTTQRSNGIPSGMLRQLPPNAAGNIYALAAVDRKWSKLSPGAQDLVASFIPRATPSAEAVLKEFFPWATDDDMSDIRWGTEALTIYNENRQRVILYWRIHVRKGHVFSTQKWEGAPFFQCSVYQMTPQYIKRRGRTITERHRQDRVGSDQLDFNPLDPGVADALRQRSAAQAALQSSARTGLLAPWRPGSPRGSREASR